MRNVLIVWRRELAGCFLSSVAYVTMTVFLGVVGVTFFVGVSRNVGTVESLSALLFGSIIFWMTFLVTVVCMRLFAEEKRLGTIETLMTAPVSEQEVVLGKYAGALSFLWIVSLPAIGYIFLLQALSPAVDAREVDAGAVVGGTVVLVLISGLFTAVGLLLSMMTRNQIVSAICIFCTLWGLILAGWLVGYLPQDTTRLTAYLSITGHMENFARGQLDARPIVLYVSGTVWSLFAATRLLESRRWLG